MKVQLSIIIAGLFCIVLPGLYANDKPRAQVTNIGLTDELDSQTEDDKTKLPSDVSVNKPGQHSSDKTQLTSNGQVRSMGFTMSGS